MARKEVAFRKARKYAAMQIQKIMRGCLAIGIVKRIKQEIKDGLDANATSIQKIGRAMLAKIEVEQKRLMKEQMDAAADEEEEDLDFEDDEKKEVRVRDWIHVYGCDPDPAYGLRRNRRMAETYYQRILKTQYIRLVSKYGIVYMDEYPAPTSAEDLLIEKEGGAALTDREQFVSVYFPQFKSGVIKREDAILIFNADPHLATIHIESSIKIRETVDFNIITIQCATRQKQARGARNKILRIHGAFAKLQRIYKARAQRQNKAAMLVRFS